jgi:AhpD family alkylhydroperoxidase
MAAGAKSWTQLPLIYIKAATGPALKSGHATLSLGREIAMNDWPEQTKELSALLRNLRGGAPEVMKAFSGIAQAALAPSALDGKTKELIALGIAVAVRCDDCIGFHVKAALQQGASREEVIDALGMAIYMGAGPSVMYASHAIEAFAQFEMQNADPSVAPA